MVHLAEQVIQIDNNMRAFDRLTGRPFSNTILHKLHWKTDKCAEWGTSNANDWGDGVVSTEIRGVVQ